MVVMLIVNLFVSFSPINVKNTVFYKEEYISNLNQDSSSAIRINLKI